MLLLYPIGWDSHYSHGGLSVRTSVNRRERNRELSDYVMLTAKERMPLNILSNKPREEELALYLNMGGQITRNTLYGKEILHLRWRNIRL